MRYLKTYRLFEAAKTGLTPEQEAFLNRYTEGSWTYNPATGLVDVRGDFNYYNEGAETLRDIKFGKVSGDFDCSGNKLTTLEGAPQEVGWSFDCRENNLISLEGAPQKVDGSFDCDSNKLTSLKGAPQKVGGRFDCARNKLTSLGGAPQEVGAGFYCRGNNLTSLEGAPQEVGGRFICDDFKVEHGQWNLKGWLEVRKKGTPKAQQLIATFLTPEMLNKEIQQDPAGMVMNLKEIWNDEGFRETRAKLVWPKGYVDQADLVGDLDDVGF